MQNKGIRACEALQLSEHSVPFEAVVLGIEGLVALTINSVAVSVGAGDILRIPSTPPHSLEATESSKMLLVMFKNAPDTGKE